MLANLLLAGQKITVINQYHGDTTGRGTSAFRLSQSEEHRIIINYYEPAGDPQVKRFTDLLNATLDFYMSENSFIENGQVKLRKKEAQVMKELDEIVRTAVKYYGFREVQGFKGFSAQAEKKLKELSQLKFENSELAHSSTPGADRRKQRQLFAEMARYDFVALLRSEVNSYSTGNLLAQTGSEELSASDETVNAILDYNREKELNPVQIQLHDETLTFLKATDQSALHLPGNAPSGTGDFNSKVLAMLEANNRKLDGMQMQINELRADQVRMWQQKQDATNNQLQAQINDLRTMVVDLVRLQTGDALATAEGGTVKPTRTLPATKPLMGITNLPQAINLFFASGSTQLTAGDQFALNEVVELMVRYPAMRIIITGYADKSGGEMENLLISQRRAEAVKKFFVQRGLSESRFVTRYFGSRDSQSINPADRKVVVEFVE